MASAQVVDLLRVAPYDGYHQQNLVARAIVAVVEIPAIVDWIVWIGAVEECYGTGVRRNGRYIARHEEFKIRLVRTV